MGAARLGVVALAQRRRVPPLATLLRVDPVFALRASPWQAGRSAHDDARESKRPRPGVPGQGISKLNNIDPVFLIVICAMHFLDREDYCSVKAVKCLCLTVVENSLSFSFRILQFKTQPPLPEWPGLLRPLSDGSLS